MDASRLTDENTGEEDAFLDLLNLPLQQAQALPSKALQYNGETAAHISSVGMKLDLRAIGLYNGADDFEVKTVTLTYQNGDVYLIMDRDGRIVNYEYGLIPEDGAYDTFCFNRPVDIEQVKHIQVNDRMLTIGE